MSSKSFSFNPHPELKGKHALFSPSQSAWLRYDEEKVIDKVRNQYRTALGSEIHEYAADEIMLGQRASSHKKSSVRSIVQEIESYIYQKYKKEAIDYGLKLIDHLNYIPKEVFEMLMCYINDGIGFKMIAEQPVQYSDKIFGTMDTVVFKDNFLRIHDLKTGSHEADMEQLETYAALFCLEYDIRPVDIEAELRLYQWDGIVIHNPTVEDLIPIIDSIITKNKIASTVEKENK